MTTLRELTRAIDRLAAAIEQSNLAPDDEVMVLEPGICPTCEGQREVDGEQCRQCLGRGRIQVPI